MQGVPPLPGNKGRSYLLKVISLAELSSTVYPRLNRLNGANEAIDCAIVALAVASAGVHPHDRLPQTCLRPDPGAHYPRLGRLESSQRKYSS